VIPGWNVLEQEFEDGAHPIANVYRMLNVPERNYPTHDRELLAIVHVVKDCDVALTDQLLW
jgi:RNase H-like domain found in reverse transcriptase